MEGISSPRISAKRNAISSSLPRLPGGFVRDSRRARTRLARSEFESDDTTVVLMKLHRIVPGGDKCQGSVDAHVTDNRSRHRTAADQLINPLHSRTHLFPRFAARRRDSEPILQFGCSQVRPLMFDLAPREAVPHAERHLSEFRPFEDGPAAGEEGRSLSRALQGARVDSGAFDAE